MKYISHLEEAKLIRRLFTDLKNITDLQKPDKIYLDNLNLLYALCPQTPEIGTVRETFIANQLASASHILEYAGYKSGDFRYGRLDFFIDMLFMIMFEKRNIQKIAFVLFLEAKLIF